MSDNDNDRHGRKPPPRPTEEVPVNKLSRSLRETDAHRIHREAEDARATLARRLAAAVCADPSALTPEKMSRLGTTGLTVLVATLRGSLPEPTSGRTAKAAGAPTKPRASASSKQPPVAAARPRRFARMSGWWDAPPPSSGLAAALMRGLLLGAFLDLIAIAGLLAAGF